VGPRSAHHGLILIPHTPYFREIEPVRTSDFILAYFSPETLLPATSIVATIAGIVMMLGRGTLRLLIRSSQGGLRRAGRIAGTSKPHLHIHDDVQTQTPGH
jgi:hypothetical protein